VPVSSEPRTDADPGHEAFAPDRFERTPSTWLAYLLVGYFMYVQASLGPILPFLREDLSLGYGAAGLHFGAFALGVLFTGLLGEPLGHLDHGLLREPSPYERPGGPLRPAR
jgi:hypothetical protein